MITPTHLYYTKSGTKKLNGASQSVLSHCDSSSPPIPTTTMPDRAFPIRRGKRDRLEAVSAEALLATAPTTAANPSNERRTASTSVAQQGRIKSTKFRGVRPRASTLPSLATANAILESDSSLPRDNYSDSFPLDDPSTISTRDDYDDEDDDDDDDDDEDDFDEDFDDDDEFNNTEGYDTFEQDQQFADVTYDDLTGSDSDDEDEGPSYQNAPDVSTEFFHHHPVDTVLGLMEDPVNPPVEFSNTHDSNPHILSGLSEEDYSDMEEDLEIAARQIKNPPTPNGDDDSMLSASRPPSTTSSPRRRRRHNNSNSSTGKKSILRQSSFDAGSLEPNGKTPRRMSVPTKPYAQTANGNLTPPSNLPSASNRRLTPDISVTQAARRPTDPGPPSAQSNLNIIPASENAAPYSEATLAAQEKLEIGLGLRDSTTLPHSPSSRSLKSLKPRSTSFFGANAKRPVVPLAARPSLLTNQIKDKQSGFDNPLEEYVGASGKAEAKPLRLKMYMPSCSEPRKPWEVIVRTDANVSNAIGFALYCYMEEKRKPELPEDMQNANKWTLRIVEEDGEPDEDFPALDRTRMLSAYKFDEFALVEATPAQVVEHEKITPSTRKAKKPAAPAATSQPAAPMTVVEEETPENVVLRVYQYPFDEMVSVLYWSGEVSVQTTVDEIVYQICVEKGLDRTQYVCKIAGHRSVIPTGAKVQSLNGQFNLELTPRRVVNKTNGYSDILPSDLQVIKKTRSANAISSVTAGTASRRTSLTNKMPTAAGQSRASADEPTVPRISFTTPGGSGGLGAAAKPGIGNHHGNPAANTSTAAHHRAASNVRASMLGVAPNLAAAATTANATQASQLLLPPETLNGIAGYQKYKIWRRQPMSFISRHERILALDGEYVHIMPADDRAWYDYSPKTSSFHINQMTHCKQSRKIPNNFKIVITKATKVSKRYDLEAHTATEAQEIVAKLKALYSGYKMNNDTPRRN